MRGAGGREAARESDDGRLGGGVGEVVGQSEDPRGRRHDDAAVALFDHVRPCGAGGVERPADVHGEVPREVVGVGFRKARPSDDAGVVDQDVEASELLDRRVDERLCAGRRGHVAAVGDRDAAGGDDLGGDGGRRFGVRADALHRAAEVVDDDAGAPVGEQERMGPADPASRARDDRDAPLEAVLVHPDTLQRGVYRPVTILLGLVPRRGSARLSAVLYSSSDRIGVITLNRPEARNAVDREMALGLEAAVDRLEDDPEVWVGVLCANTADQARPVFCAGADLKVIRETGSAATLDTERGGFGGFVYRERTKPIVVAVDGLATAGGLEIVLAADVVVATSRSAFGLAEVRRNLIAAAGGLFRLPRAIGRAPAMDAILTGEPIDARRAFDLGLVSRLVEPGAALDEALRVARQIVSAAPLAVRASRRVVLAGRERARRHAADRSRGTCWTSCSRQRTRAKGCWPSPRSARRSGKVADARAPPRYRRSRCREPQRATSPDAARSGRRVAT